MGHRAGISNRRHGSLALVLRRWAKNKLTALWWAKVWTLSLVALVAVDASIALAGRRRHGNKSVYSALLNVPEKAPAKPNPFQNDPEGKLAGKKLFEQHCEECHGRMAEGGNRAPSLLAPEVRQAPPGAIFWILSNGVVRRGMPSWSALPKSERWQIVTFLKLLRVSPATEPSSISK